MELTPDHISQLISKFLTGKLSKEEKATLDKWLEDPYNEMQFYKIIDAGAFLDKMEQYKKFDSVKAFQKVNRKHRSYKKWIGYAAVIVLPLAIAMGILSKNWQEAQQYDNTLVSADPESKDVVLSTGEGLYTLGKSDTTISINNMRLQSDREQLSYQDGGDTADKKLVYNTLQTPKGLKYKVILSDGTEVWLNSETKFRYPVDFIAANREVFIEEGEAYFDVAKNKNKPFVVNFDGRRVQVLGTQFNVKSYKEEEYDLITLVEGSIELISDNNKVELVPNQQAVINNANQALQLKTVEGSLYTAWKDNVYLYKNQPLQTIVSDLERDFNFRVFYQNPEMKQEKFSLKISRKLPFEAIFSAIEKTHEVDIEIKNNNVIIRKK
jgi:ferric-dicitrate binding protein FerR (iron transport regulator)